MSNSSNIYLHEGEVLILQIGEWALIEEEGQNMFMLHNCCKMGAYLDLDDKKCNTCKEAMPNNVYFLNQTICDA